MSEWKEVRLGDVILFNPPESIKKDTLAKKIAMEKLDTFTRHIKGFEKVKYTSGTKFKNGDTLVARITPCLENGKTAQVSILNENEVGFGSTEFIVLREKKNYTNNNFIYYLAISKKFRDIAIKSMTGTSGRQRAQKDVIENTLINIPSLLEQQKIASILSSLDDKIELNNQMNETLEEIAGALFKRWFVDFEFPNEEGLPYKSSGGEMVQSELGEIPKGWEVDRADKFYNITIGKTPPRKEKEWFSYNPSDFPWLSIKDLGDSGVFSFNTSEFLTHEAVKKFNINVVPKNTVVLSFKLTVGRVAIVNYDMVTNEAIAHFKIKSNLSSEYTYLYLKNFNYESLGSTSSIATATNSRVIKSMPFLNPNNLVLSSFLEHTVNIFKTIQNNQLEIKILTKTRDLLLPKLMSGEIRVYE
ncbi:MAG: restriction endonuclease subunit S [Spirochaetales bacterium]|nr:restriction endonuclease subunit S [Spirochaetales bacterium]